MTVFASIKILTIIGLILLALIIDLGGAPGQDRLGFRYWKHPWAAMREYIGTGNTGRFAGWFATLANAAFAYGGVEMVAVAAGEAENPRKNIPKAVRRVFWQILFFYVLGTLAIGVTVPADDDRLLNGGPGAGSSPWVIAIVRAGIPVLPHIINAVILTSASSSGNAFLYTGSRYLFALAQNRQAPRFLLYCTKKGVPIWCVLITASVGLLTYMTVSAGASSVFDWFQTLTTITSLFTWISVLIAFLRFRAACIAQGVQSKDMVFKSKFQPYTAWAALIFFIIIILFNGFAVFTHNRDGSSNWSIQDFVTAYVVIPIYLGVSSSTSYTLPCVDANYRHSSISSGRSSSAVNSSTPGRRTSGVARQRWMQRSGRSRSQGIGLRRSGSGLRRCCGDDLSIYSLVRNKC